MVCLETNGSNQESITKGRSRNTAAAVTRQPILLASLPLPRFGPKSRTGTRWAIGFTTAESALGAMVFMRAGAHRFAKVVRQLACGRLPPSVVVPAATPSEHFHLLQVERG